VAGRIIYFYVVDADGRLHGVVPTRRLLLSPPEKPVAEIMVTPLITVPASATVLDACEFFVLHKLLAFPVVDDGRLVGVVDVDLYTEEISDLERREGSDDLLQLIGAASALAVGAVALLWLGQWRVAACLLGGIAGGMACAAVLGLAMPIVLRLLRVEPRVAAGPIALAGADMVTLLLYFNVARRLLT